MGDGDRVLHKPKKESASAGGARGQGQEGRSGLGQRRKFTGGIISRPQKKHPTPDGRARVKGIGAATGGFVVTYNKAAPIEI